MTIYIPYIDVIPLNFRYQILSFQNMLILYGVKLYVFYIFFIIFTLLFYIIDCQVIDDSGPSNGRGMHVVVLNQRTGMVMAQRVFDTYMDDEPLVEFLQSVSTGRIMIFAIKVRYIIYNYYIYVYFSQTHVNWFKYK